MSVFKNIVAVLAKNSKSDEGELSDGAVKNIVVGILLFLVLAITSVVSFVNANVVNGAVLSVFSLISLLGFMLAKKPENEKVSGIIILLITFLSVLFAAIYIEQSNHGLIWLLVVPIIALYTKGSRIGSILSAGFLVFALLVIFLFIDYSFFRAEYSWFYIIKVTSVYVVLHLLVFLLNQIYLSRSRVIADELDELENETKSKDEFLSNLSHQIRTPLNNIMVISDLINEAQLDDNTKDLFDTIIASTHNLVNVVNNIVKASNIDIDVLKQSEISFNLYSTIDNTIKLFLSHDNDKIGINFSCPNELKATNLLGDPIKLKQIFLNITENILKVQNGSGMTLDIYIKKLEDEDDIVKLKFELKVDKNIKVVGNQSEDIDKTDPKFDLSLSDLLISKRIIEVNKGELLIENSDGNTSFSFILSFNKTSEKEEKPPVVEMPSAIKSSGVNVNIEDANVLLVEDNLINQKIVILSLSKVVKNIDIANNGKEALDKFGSSKYDIILMDIQMPVMDGIVATKKIREIESSSSSHTPIIAITANALSGDRENCIVAGMNDYISKPFQIEDLVLKMKNLLSD